MKLTLSAREAEVLDLVSRGLTNPQIGAALFLSPATVKSHLERIGLKLGTGSRAGMVGTAFRDGVLLLADRSSAWNHSGVGA